MTAQRPLPTDASVVMRPWTPDALAAMDTPKGGGDE